jgi:hypothetical protein
MRTRAKRLIFNNIRLGAFNAVVGYNGGGGLERFENLKIKLKVRVYQDKSWTLEKLGRRIRSDYSKAIFAQIGNTLGSYFQFKLGLSPSEVAALNAQRNSQMLLDEKDEDEESDEEEEKKEKSIFRGVAKTISQANIKLEVPNTLKKAPKMFSGLWKGRKKGKAVVDNNPADDHEEEERRRRDLLGTKKSSVPSINIVVSPPLNPDSEHNETAGPDELKKMFL